MALHDYDFALRHASIRDGDWVGFRLAWEGLGGLEGVAVPHSRQQLWKTSDPANPSGGAWGEWVWRLYTTIHIGLAGLNGTPPEDGFGDPADMLGWMRAFQALPLFQLKDVDDAVYTVKHYGYEERCIEPYDAAHDTKGGWLVILDLVQVAP